MSVSCPVKPVIKTEEITKLAPRYKIIFHNDSKTTFDFVIHVLMLVFKKKIEDAVILTVKVHNEGLAIVDVLPLEQAEFRTEQAIALARTNKFPLAVTYEPE